MTFVNLLIQYTESSCLIYGKTENSNLKTLYRAYKQQAWIIPFFCYQIFDFALNTLAAITVLVYPNSIQEYIGELPPNFPYRDDVISANPTSVFGTATINGRKSTDVLVTSNDNMVLLPPYDDVTVNGAAKEPPPPYMSA
ncbi:Lysosomal-associated transmembrane protein 4B [Saguinus oedipus]|uniref:Lysosomal-associated transmembrane protein 4B n=1 Tax=Saguinus oedipus TaxID=9490 RepID=A0ABQ9U520_SAGOE|nr:Lysosomal-associated transmembrane protein 4B [Saguinus oedipus]